MKPPSIALLLIVVACSDARRAEPPVKTKWLDLAPLPLVIQVPDGATYGSDKGTVTISARECVVIVETGSKGTLAAQAAAIASAVPGATIGRREPAGATGPGMFIDFVDARDRERPKRGFRYEIELLGTTYHCEPFTTRPDVACEERACRSLKVQPTATAPVVP